MTAITTPNHFAGQDDGDPLVNAASRRPRLGALPAAEQRGPTGGPARGDSGQAPVMAARPSGPVATEYEQMMFAIDDLTPDDTRLLHRRLLSYQHWPSARQVLRERRWQQKFEDAMAAAVEASMMLVTAEKARDRAEMRRWAAVYQRCTRAMEQLLDEGPR